MSKTELIWDTLGALFVAMIVILGTMYWPQLGFIKVRSNPMRISCNSNMKQIDGAIQQWALEQKLTVLNSYSLNDPTLLSYMKGSRLPLCPEGGIYIEGFNVTNHVRCTLAHKGHTL